jgi:hypothetical protein
MHRTEVYSGLLVTPSGSYMVIQNHSLSVVATFLEGRVKARNKMKPTTSGLILRSTGHLVMEIF